MRPVGSPGDVHAASEVGKAPATARHGPGADGAGLPGVEVYREHLETVVLPFWLERAVDEEAGGLFTCFDNRGERLLGTDKYTWSQGRAIWLLARAADLAGRGLLDAPAAHLLDLAERAADFVLAHAVKPDGSCWYLLDRLGGVRTPDTPSIYADCFVALGLAELARVTGRAALVHQAVEVYAAVAARVQTGRFPSAPYPVPDGYRAHGAAMILLGLAEQLCRSVGELGVEVRVAPEAEASRWLDAVVGTFVGPGSCIRELVSAADPGESALLSRHRTPGHALEGMAFALKAERSIGRDTSALARAVMRWAVEVGWDEEHGGLFRYVDAGGGQPTGSRRGGSFEELIVATWHTKLWWPHIEAVYALRLVVERTGDPVLARWAQKVHDYTFDTFPARPGEGSEWIQIRDRAGAPIDRVVALPVKDPFHITRGLMELVELLDGRPGATGAGR